MLFKNITTAGYGFLVSDNKRDPFNPVSNYMFANSTDPDGSTAYVDFVSNGIKFRDQYAQNYQARHIYWAMAEAPFKYANAR